MTESTAAKGFFFKCWMNAKKKRQTHSYSLRSAFIPAVPRISIVLRLSTLCGRLWNKTTLGGGLKKIKDCFLQRLDARNDTLSLTHTHTKNSTGEEYV